MSFLRRFYYWAGMGRDVENFIKACILCAVTASRRGKGILVGWGLEPPRLACIHADYSGPFQATKRCNRYIFAMVDRATGWLEMHATEDCKAETAANLLLNQWVPRYGCPRKVVTDNGRHFTAKTFEEATKALGMRLVHSTIYHPQSNGMIERRFRDMGKAIKIFGQTHGEWDDILPIFTLATRNKLNKTTGYSPAMLLYGQELRLPTAIDAKVETWHDQPTELHKLLVRRKMVDEVINNKKEKLHNESVQEAEGRFKLIDWKVGQKVYCYVDRRAIGQSKKEWIRWSGPFEILEVRDSVLVLSRNGKKITMNQTKCIALKEPEGPSNRKDSGRPERARESDAGQSSQASTKIEGEKEQRIYPRVRGRLRGGDL